MANLAALSATVFSLFARNLRGQITAPPPPAVRGIYRGGKINRDKIVRLLTELLIQMRS